MELLIEGYAEVNGDLDEILNIPLFTDPDIFSFPEICIPFSIDAPNVCPYVPDSDAEAEYDYGEGLAGTKRDISILKSNARGDLEKRATPTTVPPWYGKKASTYYQPCDSAKAYPIQMEAYPVPTSIVAKTTVVPVMKPTIPDGCTKSLNCSVENWTIKLLPGTPTALIEPTFSWAGKCRDFGAHTLFANSFL